MPPKAKRADITSQPFLFVNEDASTVNRLEKDPEADRTKQSHVQRQNFARKRLLREQIAVATGGSAEQPGEVTTAFPSSDQPFNPFLVTSAQHIFNTAEVGNLGFSAESEYVLLQSHSSTSTSQSSTPGTRAILPRPSQLTGPDPQFNLIFRPDLYSIPHGTTTSSPPPAPWFTASHFPPIQSRSPSRSPPIQDPLNNVELALNWWAPPLIQYHTSVILPSIYANELRYVSLSHMRHANAIHDDMQACMSEPAHMYAFCALTSMQMLYKEGRLLLPHTDQEMQHQVPLLFKTRAIEALRTRLQGRQVDVHVIVDVMRLMLASMVSNNLQATEAHAKAMTQMIRSLGGLESLEPYVQERVILAELYGGAKESGVLHLPLSWDIGPLSTEAIIRMEHPDQLAQSQPGDGLVNFGRLALTDALTVQAIADLVQVRQMAEYISANQSHYVEDFRWKFLRRTAVTHRLLQVQLSKIETAAEEDSDPIVDVIQTTLILSSGLEQGDQMGRAPMMYQSSLLRAQLEDTQLDSLWTPHTNVLLWISVIGGLSAYDELLPPFRARNGNWEWFVKLAALVCCEIEIEDYNHLTDSLRAFLYDTECKKEILLQFVTQMMNFKDEIIGERISARSGSGEGDYAGIEEFQDE